MRNPLSPRLATALDLAKLPPSRQANGPAVEWLTGPIGIHLPNCWCLFHALRRLPTRAALAAYRHKERDARPV